MKKNLITCALLLAASLVAITSCDDTDGESIVPHFSGITCAPAQPVPGDSITLTAVQDQVGRLINYTEYAWTFSYAYRDDDGSAVSTSVTRTIKANYDADGGANPTIGFRLPANIVSDLGVSIEADYNLSGQTAAGALYGHANRSTRITITIP